jgi:hypothetical protein
MGREEISADVRFGSKADICSAPSHVRFTPNSDTDCVLIVFKPQHRPSFAGGFEPPSNQIAVRQFSTVPAASEWDHAHAFRISAA